MRLQSGLRLMKSVTIILSPFRTDLSIMLERSRDCFMLRICCSMPNGTDRRSERRRYIDIQHFSVMPLMVRTRVQLTLKHRSLTTLLCVVIGDCCGYCPKPATPEDEEIATQESKIYVSGDLSFIKDDPGRQAIGSFNPLTDDDWTEMAYVGNTARLCQAIVEGDLEHVQDWLSQEGADPNRRDYTG